MEHIERVTVALQPLKHCRLYWEKLETFSIMLYVEINWENLYQILLAATASSPMTNTQITLFPFLFSNLDRMNYILKPDCRRKLE